MKTQLLSPLPLMGAAALAAQLAVAAPPPSPAGSGSAPRSAATPPAGTGSAPRSAATLPAGTGSAPRSAATPPAAPATAPAATPPTAASPAAPGGDPLSGKFTLEQATRGLKGSGPLVALLEIAQDSKPLGTLHCELLDDKAPLAVANFVGLARGLRPFKEPRTGQWTARPLFDNSLIHRVIPDFLIQGGDPLCQNNPACEGRPGTGDPGYAFDDEIRPELRFDRGGLLAMANRGANTNGSQFFITERETPWLTGHHTIFGTCAEVDAIKKIARVEAGPRDVPKTPVVIKKISIGRKNK